MISSLLFLILGASESAPTKKECFEQKSKIDKIVCSSPLLIELRNQKKYKFEKIYAIASRQNILQDSLVLQDINWNQKIKDCIANHEQSISEAEKSCIKKSYLEKISSLDTLLGNGLLIPGYNLSPFVVQFSQIGPLDKVEVMVVAGYSAIRELGYSKIQVNRPGKKVLIVLSSYDPVLWYLDVTPQTHVVGAILSSYSPSSLASRTRIPLYATDLGYSYNTNDKEFEKLLYLLNRLMGISRLNQYVGNYFIPEQLTLNDLSNSEELALNWPKPINSDPSVSFDLINTGFEKVKWRLDGAGGAKNKMKYVSHGVSINASTGEIYKLIYSEIEVNDAHGKPLRVIPLPTQNNNPINAEDLAYDSKRKIVSVCGWGCYRFDLGKDTWLYDSNEPIFRLSRFTYDEAHDEYVGFDCSSGNCFLYFISPEGKLVERRSLDKGALPGFERLYSQDDIIGRKLTIITQGENIILLAKQAGKVLRIWNYSRRTKKASLTYKSED